ncbi:hypothetical protein ABAC460_10435 [Asticcacaulis sp. AC460]|uniref:winged helix-turn-helix domain-containing protein n=1 Tax=Asticcacaulis sp. AC460 TaxID=1282360 RepID=UPI0003C3D2E7|nr:winged helix-turn-helix domain-containing protein [Asticcacaulis sp. AC460]ESQ90159.1 hypothetical protein ABAC460_10435 [Asticcacaulis sp. AC460]
MTASLRFDRFVLNPDNRRLSRDGVTVELNARYLDALALMVREPGKLITKDRFLEEVWRGVPVTDEALTQCIRTLRKQLGDDAARPRFIETVTKHGYRFIAPVEAVTETSPPLRTRDWRQVIRPGVAGTAGAVGAGLIGGLLYGSAIAAQPVAAGMGTVSVLLVVLCISLIVAILGGAGVSFGIALAAMAPTRGVHWSVLGGLAGGIVVGAVVKLVGLDAFNLLLGQAPANITGAPEGALVGGAVGLGAWLAGRFSGVRKGAALAALTGGVAGVLVPLLGGRMMLGSLALLGEQFPGSRLHLDGISALFGESGFGLISQLVTGGLEGALFSGCIAAGLRMGTSKPRAQGEES